MIGDFIFDNLGWVIVILIALIIASMVAVSSEQEQQHKAFMSECLKDKKQYECDVLWGQTRESHATSEMATNIAIGAVAGTIAGSASRR